MKSISRRNFVGVAAVAALGSAALAGCSGSASKASSAASSSASASAAASSAVAEEFMAQGKGEHLVVGRRGKLFKIAPSVIAEKLGYYDEEGCDVEFQTVELAEGFASLAADNIDGMLMGIVQTCEYIAKGSSLYIIGGTVLDGSEIIVPKDFDKELKTAEDFKGYKFGFHRPETGQIAFRAWLIENGVDINNDIEFIPLDNEHALCTAVEKGEVDMAMVNNAYGYIDKDLNIKVLMQPKELTGDYPCCRQNVSNKAFHEKYLSLVDFETAILRGYKVYKEDKDQTIDIMVEYSEQARDVVEAGLYGTADYDTPLNLSPDPCSDAVKKFYESIKLVESTDPSTAPSVSATDSPDIDPFVITSVYRTALDTLMEREPDEQFWKDLDAEFKKNNS